MTFKELADVARRRGYVRWLDSGVIERLRYAENRRRPGKKIVLAVAITPGKKSVERSIRPCPDEYRCEAVTKEEVEST